MIKVIRQSVLSTEDVQVDVEADGGSYDPTADAVAFAFMVAGDPGSGDWHAGGWGTPLEPGVYPAQCLVGPGAGGVPLALNTYAIWVRIVDNPEIPVRKAGLLVIE